MNDSLNAGLRRRSPNPNSPIPYSPALLSPYVHPTSSLSTGYNDPLERYHHLSPQPGPTPTIRLVAPNALHPPTPALTSRSQSDDQHVRESTIAGSVASLRRHGTDPKSYPSANRDAHLFPRDPRDRPVPPLPLNIRRNSNISTYTPPIHIHHAETPSTFSSPLTTPKSVVSTLKSLRNPFRRTPSTTHNSPALSSRSMKTTRSQTSVKSYDSRSSTSTLPVPFYPTSFWDAFGSDEKGAGEKGGKGAAVVGLSGEVRLTNKFPGKFDKGKKERWTGFKWALLISIITLFGYGLAGLVWAMMILLRIEEFSDVTMVSDPDLVIFLTLASLLCILSSLIGLTGLFLNSRPILAFYALLLWPTLLSLCLVGYTSYKRGSLQLDRKLNQAWSQFLDDEQRLRIQNSLACCGYYNPLHDATYSKKCYPRTPLPGCKGRWGRYEKQSLHDFATAAFSVIPFHILNIITSLLCSNHVNKTFGKGLTPPHYRLKMSDVRANALAALGSMPKHGKSSRPASALSRNKAISYRHKTERPVSRSSWGGSTDTLTEAYDMRRDRVGVGEVLREAGPRGRALREARERGIL